MTELRVHTVISSTGRMTNQSTANQANTNTAKDKEEKQRDDNTDVAYKDAGHCSRNTHSLLLGLTVLGTCVQAERRISCFTAAGLQLEE